MGLYLILPDQVDELWPKIEDEVKRTDDPVTHSEDVKKFAKSGQWQLWIFTQQNEIQAVGTTSFAYYGNKKICRMETVAGSGREKWIYCLKDIEEWAKLNACIGMDVFGRKGWEKVLKPFDYEFEAILLRKYF